MRIVKLEVSNFKRLSALTIVPKGSRVTLAGKNGAGKSSTIDAIESVLGGGKAIPPEPVRRGARKAYIIADLGDLVVERTFSSKGTSLVVRDKDGTTRSSPQKILDELIGKLCFDPLSFARAKPADQDRMLKEMLGLDFTELDADRQALYDERTRLNRKLRDDEALYNAMPEHPGVPDTEISVAEVAKKLDAAREHNHAREQAEGAVARQEADVAAADAEIARLEAQLKAAKEKRDREFETLATLRESLRTMASATDTAELEATRDTAEQTNAKVRANQARAAALKALRALEQKRDDTTAAIAAIDEKKQAALAAADFPVPGLGFDELGPTLNGVPLEQASQAEKVKLSCVIGLKLNPTLKVLLIREGVYLDDDSLVFLEQLAEEHDAQIWIELVKTDDPTAVIIEDGHLKEPATAAEE